VPLEQTTGAADEAPAAPTCSIFRDLRVLLGNSGITAQAAAGLTIDFMA